MNYEWCKIELLDRHVRFGRCSVVEVLGQHWLRVEVPYLEPKFGPRIALNFDAAKLDTMDWAGLADIVGGTGEIVHTEDSQTMLRGRIRQLLAAPHVEQFASVEDYSPNALFSRTVVTEEQVREALKSWKPSERPQLPSPAGSGDWDERVLINFAPS